MDSTIRNNQFFDENNQFRQDFFEQVKSITCWVDEMSITINNDKLMQQIFDCLSSVTYDQKIRDSSDKVIYACNLTLEFLTDAGVYEMTLLYNVITLESDYLVERNMQKEIQCILDNVISPYVALKVGYDFIRVN